MQYDRKISKAGTQSQLNMDNNKISDNKKINKRYRKFGISKEDQFRIFWWERKGGGHSFGVGPFQNEDLSMHNNSPIIFLRNKNNLEDLFKEARDTTTTEVMVTSKWS